jgi:hypothetical protein
LGDAVALGSGKRFDTMGRKESADG